VSKLTLPSNLESERNTKIGKLQKQAEQVDIIKYVKFSLYAGIIFAIGAFLYVGSWYDKQYGFDGSAGAAIFAAIGVLIIFAIIGAVIGNSVKQFYLREIERVKVHYDNMLKEIEASHAESAATLSREAAALHSKFANNEHIQTIIANATKNFIGRIQQMPRPNNRKAIECSARFSVQKSSIWYEHEQVLSFGPEGRIRLRELSSAAERKAVAQVIADNVAAQVKAMFPKDPSGADTLVTVACGDDKNSIIEAVVTYSCTNGFYEDEIPW